jgi:hypothetical protein
MSRSASIEIEATLHAETFIRENGGKILVACDCEIGSDHSYLPVNAAPQLVPETSDGDHARGQGRRRLPAQPKRFAQPIGGAA